MAVQVAIIYYNAAGTTYRLAQAVEEGASAAGADVRLRKVRELAPDDAVASNQGWAAHRLESQHVVEASLDDLPWAEAVIFGTPTRYGLPMAQVKQFLAPQARCGQKAPWSTRSAQPSPVPAPHMVVRRGPSSMSIVPFMTGAQLLSVRATPIRFNSKPVISTEHHPPATMARLNRTRPHPRRSDSIAGVSRN